MGTDAPILDRHQHPVAMLRYTYRYLFLLLVPLLRGARYIRTPQGLYAWLRGAWIDLSVVFLLLLLPYLAWQFHTYSLTEEGFVIRRGILLRRVTYVPRGSIVTLSVERPFWLRPLRAVRISVDTDAGSRRQADLTLTVGEARAKEILDRRRAGAKGEEHVYRPHWWSVAVLSLLVSNPASGIILLATTFRQAGKLWGNSYRDQLFGGLENVAGLVTIVPRTAALIALVLLCGWGISAVRDLLRYLPFRVTRTPDALTIRTGLLTRRDYSCTASSVAFVDYRQSIVSRLLRLHMVFISCIGYGKGKNAMSVLLPVSPVHASCREVRALLPEFPLRGVQQKAAPWSLYRYVFYPLWGMILLYPASRVAQHLLPQWSELIYYLSFMAYLPCAWQFLVKTIDRRTSGVRRSDGFLTLRYSKWYTFHTVVVPEEKVIAYALTQTPFQYLAKNCDLLVYTYDEGSCRHRVRNLPLDRARSIMTGMPEIPAPVKKKGTLSHDDDQTG